MKRMSAFAATVVLVAVVVALSACNGAKVQTSGMPPPQALLADAASSAKLPIVAPAYFPTSAKHLWRGDHTVGL